MSAKHLIRLIVVLIVAVGSNVLIAAAAPSVGELADDPSPPDEPVKLIFIHHSCGDNWLADADLLGIGQELVLPLDAPAVARVPAPTATPIPPTLAPAAGSSSGPAPGTPGASPVPTAVPAAPPPADVAAWPRETARLINQVRAQHGLGPLTYNETLARAAQPHADDCAQRGWCSHTGSDGADIEARILRAGYEPTGWAECWAQNQSPQEAVEAWMDEVPPNDAHRRTLLTTWLSEIGVGVAKARWGYYFIADFGRP